MLNRYLSVFLVLMLSGLAATAQTPTADQLNALRNLPKDQQDALQGILGTGTGTGTKTDSKLSVPETVQPNTDQSNELQNKYRKGRTLDDRTLRQSDEDPELRPDDTVLIDLTPIEPYRNPGSLPNGANPAGNEGGGNGAVNGVAGIGGLNGNDGGMAGTANDSAGGTRGNRNTRGNNDYGRVKADVKAETRVRTDEEKEESEEKRQLILKNNPYHLNRFGVLELPGLPSIPLAGLTAEEATNRLSADSDLRDFTVKLTLLRLQPFDEQALKPFGYDLFEGAPSTFAPVSDIQVPMDYLVGPGDTLNVQLYGNEPASYVLTVGRDGRINFPKLGPIMVSGMSFDRARAAIEQGVAQQLIGSRVSVTMANLRSIRVFVLGDAEKPGSYTVSGLSTMTNALFVSGGVKKIGSLRKIELRRNGQLVTVLDLYDLLLHGNTNADRQLMPGDVIFIPPVGNTVSVYGAVRRPAIYELKSEKSIEQVIDIAGGLLPDADGKQVQLERIEPSRQREMRNIDLTAAAGRSAELANGDKLRVPVIRPTLENSVVLTGYVFRPGSFEYHAGLRLSDILPSFDELRPNADRHYIMIRREIPPQEKVEVISADLEHALGARGSAADPELRPRDQILVFNLSASRERVVAPVIRDLELQGTPEQPAQLVSIAGKVNAPGRYPLERGMHVSDLIRAGGSLEDAAYGGEAELTRYEVVNGNARQTELIPIDLAAVRRGDAGADVQLKPYDVLLIKVTPQWEEPGNIILAGEVRFPGKYPIHRGETLSSVLQRAGGFTDVAFVDGAVYIREELKQRERDQLDSLANRLQSDLTSLSLEVVSSSTLTSNANGGAGGAQALAIGQQLMTQLRQLKPVGRLVIDVNRVVKGRPGTAEDVLVRDGDKLLIPKRTQEILILGEVQSPTSHVYQAGLTRNDYLAKSGGITQKADKKRIYVVRANGDVVSGERSSGWFRRTQATDIRPGDTIIVPLDTERVRKLPLWQAVTSIIYNLTLGIYAIRHF
ncbi:MAG: SLBB domain-containing protein [Pseudomonadota bacterium]|nr:SLBB domain-containing protein [Pseudomonadota bacterium]